MELGVYKGGVMRYKIKGLKREKVKSGDGKDRNIPIGYIIDLLCMFIGFISASIVRACVWGQ